MNLYWKANYSDESALEQFNSDGSENKYQDIDRDKLTRFDIIDKDTRKTIYSCYLSAGKQLIYRRRTLIDIGRGMEKRVVVYLVGWKEVVMTPTGSKAIIAINYIHPDGSISLDGARNNLELLDFEL